MKAPTRKVFLVTLTMLLIGGVAAFNIADEDTLSEQAQKLHEIEPYGLPGLRLDTWDLNGSTLRATYDGNGGSNWFTLRIFATKDRARTWFAAERAALGDEEEVQEINTFADVEYCASVGGATRCIGWDENRAFEGSTSGVGGSESELDALLLTRTARKHWYRLYN